MKFPIKDFFSKCDQFRTSLRIWPYLLKKPLNGKLPFLCIDVIFCAPEVTRSNVKQRNVILRK